MNIIIVGGGISGLSTYLFLKKHLPASTKVTILEAYPTASGQGIGGGLGVSSNGMLVLKALDPAIHAAVKNQGYPVPRFQFKNAKGWSLGGIAVCQRDGPEMTVMSSRQGVWDCLYEHVPASDLKPGKRVASIGNYIDGKRTVTCADGEVFENVDLVIGADGVKGICTKIVVGEGFSPHYEGLVGIGGFISTAILPPLPLPAPQSPVVMTFGPNGFFGYSPVDAAGEPTSQSGDLPPYGSRGMWWSTYQADTPPVTTKDKAQIEDIQKRLVARHAKWGDPIVQKIIKESSVDQIVPVWTMPKLPTWTKDGIVLVGDAAHGKCFPI